MVVLTDGRSTAQYIPAFGPILRALNATDILRIGKRSAVYSIGKIPLGLLRHVSTRYVRRVARVLTSVSRLSRSS